MSDQVAPVRYLVLGDMGSCDGPFTMEELRQRLRTGRLRTDDRLQDAATHAPVEMTTLIPDAVALQAQAKATASDRIRRKTSDRLAAVHDRPEPIAVAQERPSATAGTLMRPRGPLIASILAGAIGLWVLWVVWDGVRFSSATMGTSDLAGRWVVDETAARALMTGVSSDQAHVQQSVTRSLKKLAHEVPGLVMAFGGEQVTFTSTVGTHIATVDVLEAGERFVVLSVEPPHPLLGKVLFFERGQSGPSWYLDETPVPLAPAP